MIQRNDMAQLSMAIKKTWKKELEELAREKAYKTGKDVNKLDLIRTAIKKVYKLKD